MTVSAVMQKVLDWLRAGYPDGVPRTDYVPLLVVLARSLTPEEVAQVADELVLRGHIDGAIDADTVRQAVTEVTQQPALQGDVRRVEERLAAVGWAEDSLPTEA